MRCNVPIQNQFPAEFINENSPIAIEKQEVIGDLFSGANGNERVSKSVVSAIIPEVVPFSGELQPFHRNDCLVVDKGWVGHLQDMDSAGDTALFHPLQLPSLQKARAEAYIAVRDAYQELYNKEAKFQKEYKEERENLNHLYDAFVKRYGNLNSADNIKLIKTDSAGKEIPYLERVVGGVVHKADIFHRPVSFSTTTLATDNPDEALASSLNKYGKVDLDYMSQISGQASKVLKEALEGRIFFNSL